MNIDELTAAEVARQDTKWGVQDHPDGTDAKNTVLANFARDDCNEAFEKGHGTWRHILMEEMFEAFAEEDIDALIQELIQCRAVITNWLLAIERRSEVAA